jgi:hypothetical protein
VGEVISARTSMRPMLMLTVGRIEWKAWGRSEYCNTRLRMGSASGVRRGAG